MEETAKLVGRAQAGDIAAYDQLVRRFQDRAVGYAASVLGDLDLAQDAAQEAFLEACRCLPTLRAPAAFPVWLRRIVFKHCDRLMRGKNVSYLPIEAAARIASEEPGPEEAAERRERRVRVQEAIASLPEGERVVVTLFYLGGCSHRDIAAFLEVPISTVKNRLYAARGRLKARMLSMVEDDLQEARPSRDAEFRARVGENITRTLAEFAAGDSNEAEIRQHHPLARFRDPHPVYRLYSSLLLWAIARGVSEVHLEPTRDGLLVRFLEGGVSTEVMTLPASLREPLTLRIKDGAVMNVLDRSGPQKGRMPVRSGSRLYELFVASAPAEHGERVVLRFVLKEESTD